MGSEKISQFLPLICIVHQRDKQEEEVTLDYNNFPAFTPHLLQPPLIFLLLAAFASMRPFKKLVTTSKDNWSKLHGRTVAYRKAVKFQIQFNVNICNVFIEAIMVDFLHTCCVKMLFEGLQLQASRHH